MTGGLRLLAIGALLGATAGFAAAGEPKSKAHSEAKISTVYKLGGSKTLSPASIVDDGLRTYITWVPNQAIPAVFAVGAGGGEEMVNGHMRNGALTIDRVYDRLIFRTDKEAAVAKRVVRRER